MVKDLGFRVTRFEGFKDPLWGLLCRAFGVCPGILGFWGHLRLVRDGLNGFSSPKGF